MKANTGDIVLVTSVGFRKGMIGEVVNLDIHQDQVCALVHFDEKRWRSHRAWIWQIDLVPAPVIDRLGMIDG